jgi:hypothetical protein
MTKRASKKSVGTAKKVSAKSKTASRKSASPAARTRSSVAAATAAEESAATGPLRGPRRAIFVDVENTSSELDLMRVLEGLGIDRVAQPTELTAVGNWKAVGQRLARRLAGLGAHLVHSAPMTGVRDWSDLWIAVAAGCWLGTSRAGDTLDVVSDDRAFDAIGDAAAMRGVAFRRISYRSVSASQPEPTASEPTRRPRRRRGRRAKSAVPSAPARLPTVAPEIISEPPSPAAREADAHGASEDQILSVLTRLTGGNLERWINLDVLANALKAEGFTRPPGSPRLVTRIRHFKGIEISTNGMVRLTRRGALPPKDESEAPPAKRRPRRRGGRGRRRRNPESVVQEPNGSLEAQEESPGVE